MTAELSAIDLVRETAGSEGKARVALPSWSKTSKIEAKAEGLYLLKMEINGYYAKNGPIPGANVGAALTVRDEDTAFALMGIQLVLSTRGRVPEEYREQTVRGMSKLLEGMFAAEKADSDIMEAVRELRRLFPKRDPKAPCVCKDYQTCHENNPKGHGVDCPRWGTEGLHSLDEKRAAHGAKTLESPAPATTESKDEG